jgi:two-component system, NarL family, response regulator NreC
MNEQPPSRVLVVDDHPIVRHGIAELLGAQPDMQCAGEADSAAAALHLLRDAAFDLIVVDINLPGISGLELVRRLRASGVETPVLVLSMHEETVYAERALAAGARGYLMKQEATDKLVLAARKLLAGGIYVSGAMEQRMLDRLVGTRALRQAPTAGIAALNEREFEVLQMIAQGLTSIEIAQRICRSLKSVEAYRASIRTKLGAKSTVDLARLAIEIAGTRQG